MRDLLAADEVIEIKLRGQAKEALICTDRRVIILKTGIMAGATFGTKLFQAPYRNISSVDVNFGIMWRVFEVLTGGNQHTKKSAWRLHGTEANASEAPNSIGLNSRGQADLFRQACNHIMLKVGVSEIGGSGPAPQAPFSMADELRKLAELRQEGLLTTEEFEAQKRAVMGGNHAASEPKSSPQASVAHDEDVQPTSSSIDEAIQRALRERSAGISSQDDMPNRVVFGKRSSPPR